MNQEDQKKIKHIVENFLSSIKSDYSLLHKSHIRAWKGWLALGLTAGIAAGIIFVANRSGELEKGRAYESSFAGTITISGRYSGFIEFPKRFFDESLVAQKQILRVTDAQYFTLKEMHNGKSPYDFTKIIYDLSAYGHTTPEGIALGDSAFPGLNEGNPRWEVMSHEQGHNFFGATSSFYGVLAFGHPFLQESFAVLSAFYTYHTIKNFPLRFFILPAAVKSLDYDFNNGRNYQEGQYKLYLARSKPFDIDDVLTSQALDYQMIVYGEAYGWKYYQRFTKAYEDGIASEFLFQQDGASAIEQSTYVVAALSAAFTRDLRADFAALNFPIDTILYQEIYPKIFAYINK